MSLPKFFRALQLVEPGPTTNFRVVEKALRPPAHNEVVVKVAGCAVAFRDVLDRKGAFKFIHRPTVLGHEFSGTVAAAGAGSHLKEGDKVVSLHWNQDEAWPSPLKAAGAVNSMFGLTCDGGYAEYVIAPSGSFAYAPTSLPLVDASCIVSTFGTIWHAAVTKGGLREGQTVLVTGASGGVGTAAVAIAKGMGCHVIGATSSPDKVTFLKDQIRCDEVVVASDGKFKVPQQVDMVIEAVGGPTFSSSLRSVRPGGAIVLVGNVENSVCDLPLGYCILNSIRILGSDSIPALEFNSNFTEFFNSKFLKPSIQEKISLEGIPSAHSRLEQKLVSGRIVADLSL